MKTYKFLTFGIITAFSFLLTACSDDDDKNGEEVLRGDNRCRIENMVINLSNGETIRADVYDYDKSIDILYTTTQLNYMQSATASLTLSEGASVSPDPSTVTDYTTSVSFTVTALDGTTKRTYTTYPSEKVIQTYTKISAQIEKSATEMGIGNYTVFKQIGASGNNIVVGSRVFNGKTLTETGSLNMTGYDGLQIAWLTNDEAGNLVASLTADGDFESTPVTIACWKNGYNQPGETILGPSTSMIAGYLSVGGDLTKGTALVSAIGGRAPAGNHFCWEFTDGVRTGYYGTLNTGQASNDGSWGQQVAPCSGDISGTWYLWDSVPGGHNVMTWSGWDGISTISGKQIAGAAPNGPNNWGNYSKGSLRAFAFNKTDYAAVYTTGWPCTYVSIVDTNGDFLLNPNEAILSYPISDENAYIPVGAYYLDKSDNCGYVYALVPGGTVKCWKLEVAEL